MKKQKNALTLIDSINASIKENQEKFFLEDLELLYTISKEEDFGKNRVVDDGKIFNAIEWILFHADKQNGLTDFQLKLLRDVLKNDLNKEITPQKDTRPPHQRIDKGKNYFADSIYNVILSEKPQTINNKKLCEYINKLIQLRRNPQFVIMTKR